MTQNAAERHGKGAECRASRLAYLYEWRNLIYVNRFVGLTGIEIWDGRR